MSDANCTLILSGTVIGDQATALFEALLGLGWHDGYYEEGDDIFALLMEARDETKTLVVELDDIWDGQMTPDLQAALESLNLPYAWSIGMSDSEGPRTLVCNGGGGDFLCLSRNPEGDLTMPISLTSNPQAVARYQHFAALLAQICKGPFITAPTAHQILSLSAEALA